MEVKTAYGVTFAFHTTLCTRMGSILDPGKSVDVQGPAATTTSVTSRMTCSLFLDRTRYSRLLTTPAFEMLILATLSPVRIWTPLSCARTAREVVNLKG